MFSHLSRRARTRLAAATVGAMGLLAVSGCSGLVLANFTRAGMMQFYAARQPAYPVAEPAHLRSHEEQYGDSFTQQLARGWVDTSTDGNAASFDFDAGLDD